VKQVIVFGKEEKEFQVFEGKRRVLFIEQETGDENNPEFEHLISSLTNYFNRGNQTKGIKDVLRYTDREKMPAMRLDMPMDWDILMHQDDREQWIFDHNIQIKVPLNGIELETTVEIWRLKIKGATQDIIVPLIQIPRGVSDTLYVGEPTSGERLTQGVFYTRAVMKTLEALDISPEIFQIHEAMPAISFTVDLLKDSRFKDIKVLQKGKENVIAFAHTVVPQAFPTYSDFSMIEKVTGWTRDMYREFITSCTGSEAFNPWYALSRVARCIGTVSPEHKQVMESDKEYGFGEFIGKYFYIEDSIWPFYWLMPEQIQAMKEGRRLSGEELFNVIARTRERFYGWVEKTWGISLERDRPLLLNARRIADYKY
ncbi:MAG: hypothetical protein KAR32_14850, partial [Candidatus Omnitrophica bacterium]|nr:hypothetical protein [Candidatus Omnitrophota bacterium]